MFGTACTPERPLGTCMVSSEGACAAYYNYGRLCACRRVRRRAEPAGFATSSSRSPTAPAARRPATSSRRSSSRSSATRCSSRSRTRLSLELNGARLAFTTDSYVVKPLFFPGGDIGELAVNGTVNDLAVAGARPL